MKDRKADVNRISFSPDGKQFVTASDDKTVRIWQTDDWTVARTLEFDNWVVSAGYSPNGRRFAVAERGPEPDQNRITFYDAETWDVERSWQAHHTMIQGFDWSPDSKLLATASHDRGYFLWDLDRVGPWQEMNWGGAGGALNNIVSLRDGKHVVAGESDGVLNIWDWRVRNPQPQHTIVALIQFQTA